MRTATRTGGIRTSAMNTWEIGLDLGLFTSVGYLSGRCLNWLAKWSLKPNLFSKTGYIDLNYATSVSAIFIIVDRVAKTMLKSIIDETQLNKPTNTVLRVGTEGLVSIWALNLFSPSLKLPQVEYTIAATFLTTAVVAYSLMLLLLETFNERQ